MNTEMNGRKTQIIQDIAIQLNEQNALVKSLLNDYNMLQAKYNEHQISKKEYDDSISELIDEALEIEYAIFQDMRKGVEDVIEECIFFSNEHQIDKLETLSLKDVIKTWYIYNQEIIQNSINASLPFDKWFRAEFGYQGYNIQELSAVDAYRIIYIDNLPGLYCYAEIAFSPCFYAVDNTGENKIVRKFSSRNDCIDYLRKTSRKLRNCFAFFMHQNTSSRIETRCKQAL